MNVEKDSRARLLTATVLLLLFGAGFLAGFATDRRLVASDTATSGTRDASRRSDRGSRSLIIDRVDLDASQRLLVDSIVEHYRETMAELQDEYRPRYREIVGQTREDIKGVLTTDQTARYDSLLAERHRSREEGGQSRR